MHAQSKHCYDSANPMHPYDMIMGGHDFTLSQQSAQSLDAINDGTLTLYCIIKQ
jgi:hypothetical protein